MEPKSTLPATISGQVVSVGESVSPAEVDTYGRMQEIHDKSHKLRTVLAAWEKQQEEERGLRKFYARRLIISMFVQLGVVNVALFLMGFGCLKLSDTIATTFIISVFGEIAAMVFVVTKYLFPEIGKEALKLIEKL